MTPFLSEAQGRRFEHNVAQMPDKQVLHKLMMWALDTADLRQQVENAEAQLALWQHEWATRLVLNSNDDQPGFDRASAQAAVDSLLMDLGSLQEVLNHLTPDVDEEALTTASFHPLVCDSCGQALDDNDQCDNEECERCPRYGQPTGGEE